MVQAIIRHILCIVPTVQIIYQYLSVYHILIYFINTPGPQSAWHLIPAFPQNVSFGNTSQMRGFRIRFYTRANRSRTRPRTKSQSNFLETNHTKVDKVEASKYIKILSNTQVLSMPYIELISVSGVPRMHGASADAGVDLNPVSVSSDESHERIPGTKLLERKFCAYAIICLWARCGVKESPPLVAVVVATCQRTAFLQKLLIAGDGYAQHNN